MLGLSRAHTIETLKSICWLLEANSRGNQIVEHLGWHITGVSVAHESGAMKSGDSTSCGASGYWEQQTEDQLPACRGCQRSTCMPVGCGSTHMTVLPVERLTLEMRATAGSLRVETESRANGQ